MQPRPAMALAGLLVLAITMSGCVAGDSSTFGPGESGGTATAVNAPGNLLSLAMSASPSRAPAPATVEFAIKAPGAPANVSWGLDFGDGSKPYAGGGLPATVEHTYRSMGTFTANLTVEDPPGARSTATLQVEVLSEREAASPSSSDEGTTTSSSEPTSTSVPPSTTRPRSTTSSSSTTTTSSSSSSSESNTTTTSSSTSDTNTTTSTSSPSSTDEPTPTPTTTSETTTSTSESPTSTEEPTPTSSQSSTDTSTTDSSTDTTTSETQTSTDPPA